jgi:hypothetical protein
MRPCRQCSSKIGFLVALPGKPIPPNPGFSDSVPQKVFCCCSQEFSDCCCFLPPLQAALFRCRLRRAPDQASTRRQRQRAQSRTAGCTGAPLLAATPRLAPSISTLPHPAVHLHRTAPRDHAGTHAAQLTRQCNRPQSRLEGDGCSGDAAVHDDLRRGTQGTPSQDTQDCSGPHTYLESGKT